MGFIREDHEILFQKLIERYPKDFIKELSYFKTLVRSSNWYKKSDGLKALSRLLDDLDSEDKNFFLKHFLRSSDNHGYIVRRTFAQLVFRVYRKVPKKENALIKQKLETLTKDEAVKTVVPVAEESLEKNTIIEC